MQGDPEKARANPSESPPDLELIRGTGAGSEECFRLLFRRWSPRLGRFLIQATGSREAGEDLLQEAFLRILRAAPRFSPRGKVSSWMYRICANLAYSHWRRIRSSPFAYAGFPEGFAETMSTRAEDAPDRERDRNAFVDDAQAALRRLPENQRMVFLLKVEQGLRYEEIASILQCPLGTAKSRFHHAVRKLRESLSEWDEKPETPWRTTNGV
jgi:RNA polymerase sigma-70 factor (ECF subfamily)